jgi:hypothetical protein
MARRRTTSHRDALRSRTYAPRGEALEPRLVLSLSAAADGTVVTSAQAAALYPSLSIVTSRLTEIQTAGDDERLWFGITLDGGTELPDYALDLGQGEGVGSLIEQGLDFVGIDVWKDNFDACSDWQSSGLPRVAARTRQSPQ